MRIIGHECGHEFFGDSYASALRNHEEEAAEETARKLILERLPDLSRTLVEAVTLARRLGDLLDFRERVFSAITLTAVNAMRRARISDQLTIETESQATDDKGRRILERVTVSTVRGLDMLMPRTGVLAALMKGIRVASLHWPIAGDDLDEGVREMSRQDVFGAAKALHDLDVAIAHAQVTHQGLAPLLTSDGLLGMAKWGRHGQCPKPFWIEVVGSQVYVSKGVRPRFWDRGPFLKFPDEDAYELVVVT